MLEDKVSEIVTLVDRKRRLYLTSNQIYDKINMKTGLILTGFDTVMGQLMPLLGRLGKK